MNKPPEPTLPIPENRPQPLDWSQTRPSIRFMVVMPLVCITLSGIVVLAIKWWVERGG